MLEYTHYPWEFTELYFGIHNSIITSDVRFVVYGFQFSDCEILQLFCETCQKFVVILFFFHPSIFPPNDASNDLPRTMWVVGFLMSLDP